MAKSQSGSPLGLRLVPPYERFRHAEAHLSGGRAAVFNSVLGLRDAKYLQLESQRTDGTWAGTLMWFAVVDDIIFLRTEADSPEVRRMSRRPIIRVAACTMRGKPPDDYIECMACIVPQGREAQAEAALRRGYGLIRCLINRFIHGHHIYLELTPFNRKELRVPADSGSRLGVRTLRGDCAGPRKVPPNAA
jgi:PPOX class probable F420-dependent enzyme